MRSTQWQHARLDSAPGAHRLDRDRHRELVRTELQWTARRFRRDIILTYMDAIEPGGNGEIGTVIEDQSRRSSQNMRGFRLTRMNPYSTL